MHPNPNGLDLIETSTANTLGVSADNSAAIAQVSRSKSNSFNKTPDIKSQFRKNENLVGGNGGAKQGSGSFLGQQADMIIRGRSDKQAHSALQQYASHELPSVVLKQKNTSSLPPGSL